MSAKPPFPCQAIRLSDLRRAPTEPTTELIPRRLSTRMQSLMKTQPTLFHKVFIMPACASCDHSREHVVLYNSICTGPVSGSFTTAQSQWYSQLSQPSPASASFSSIEASSSPRCIALRAASAEENFTLKLPSVPLLRSWVCKLGGSNDGCIRPLLLLLAVHRCVASKSTLL